MGIDDESSHPELCSEVADGVTRNIVRLFREPDAGNLPVRFDEREQETEPSQTGLRRRGESHVEYPPGDYSHCACSRLYAQPAAGVYRTQDAGLSAEAGRDNGPFDEKAGIIDSAGKVSAITSVFPGRASVRWARRI